MLCLITAVTGFSCAKREMASGADSSAGAPSAGATAANGNGTAENAAIASIDAGPVNGFEGTIDFVARAIVDGERGEESFNFICRGDKIRWAIAGGRAWRLYDGASHTVYTVYPTEKLVLVTPEKSMVAGDAGPEANARANAADAGAWKVETFDPNGSMAGRACERVHVSRGAGAPMYDACVAHGLPAIPLTVISTVAAQAAPFMPVLAERDLFPLASIERGAGDAGVRGARLVSQLATTTVNAHPVDPAQFVVPPEYKRMENTSLRAGTRVKL
jgi:hypothetical protein